MLNVLTRPLAWVIAGFLAVVIVALAWFTLQVDPIFSSPGRQEIIIVQPGASISTIASELRTKGVIASPFAFRLDSLIFGTPLVHPGEYQLRQRSSFAQVRAVLTAPGIPIINVTAGLTLREVENLVAQDVGTSYANRFAKAANAAITTTPYVSSGSLEGLIGPGSYLVTSQVTASDLVREMVNAFTKEATSAGLSPGTTINGLSAYQLVIAASIVEKEGYYPKNMPKVARVIFNRLARGGTLQMDSTVLYYYGQDGGVVTAKMLKTQTPYNTYLSPGLTPTPICTVSPSAIEAVLHAPPGAWLYFVLIDNQGNMHFSTTFQEQLKWERKVAAQGLG
ncbi:MAG: endolytic transglycosylase MltG [Acidimicrobiaceae bacterium]|nr:endolytic transglycosylase MltG [Acidimicrobiaceae bacterium]